MKILLTSIALILLTASCSSQQAKEAVYNMMHGKQRQDCLQQRNQDCPRSESYNEYKQKRDEVLIQ